MDPEVKQFFENLTETAKRSANEDIKPPVILDLDLVKSKNYKLGKPDISVNKQQSKNLSDDFFDGTEGQLTIDVYENPNEIIIESTLAGVKLENLDINIGKESVTIRGKRERERKIEEENFLYQECYWGYFSRSVRLPEEVLPNEAEASLRNGILTIKIPKLSNSKNKKLKVRGN